MAHSNVLGIQNDQRLFPVHGKWLTGLILGVYLRKQIVRRILCGRSLLFLFFKNSRLGYLVTFVCNVCASTPHSLQRVSEEQAAN